MAVTIAFVFVGGYCVWQCARALARPGRPADLVGYGLHALMCVSMTAMVWAPPPVAAWQMALFATACGWFAVQALGITPSTLRVLVSAVPGPSPAPPGRVERLRCAHHAILAAAMLWMFHLAAASTMTHRMTAVVGRHPGGLDRIVAGMGGAYGATTAAVLIAAGLSMRPRPAPRLHPAGDDLTHGLMAAGMATMLLTMA